MMSDVSRMIRIAIIAAVGLLSAAQALAQSNPSPAFSYGSVPTAGQWNGYFRAKQDYLGFTPFSTNGGSLNGELVTLPSAALLSGLNIGVGIAPATPVPGDIWLTTSGLFYRSSSTTYGPIGVMSGDATITPGGVITIGSLNGTPISSYALLASPAFTGAVSVTSSSTSAAQILTLSATSDTNGVGLRLVGNGGTTPSKTFGVLNGSLYIKSDSGLSIITIDDVGNLTVAGNIKTQSVSSIGISPTNSGSCAITTLVGGSTIGTFVANGACASGTVILSFVGANPATNGWACFAQDRTTQADNIKQSASTTSSATFQATMAASDVVQFSCSAY